jgi:hypothetical protein
VITLRAPDSTWEAGDAAWQAERKGTRTTNKQTKAALAEKKLLKPIRILTVILLA